MSTTMTTTRKVRPGIAALWVAQVLLALMFLMAALPKLSGDASITNVFVLGISPAIPVAFLLVAGAIVWFRRSATRALIRQAVGQ